MLLIIHHMRSGAKARSRPGELDDTIARLVPRVVSGALPAGGQITESEPENNRWAAAAAIVK